MKTEYLLSVAYFIFLQRKGRAFVQCDQFFFREKSFFVDFLDISQEKVAEMFFYTFGLSQCCYTYATFVPNLEGKDVWAWLS